MKWKIGIGVLASVFALFMVGRADASLIVTSGNNTQNTDNVISNACSGGINGPALTIKGCLNTDHSQLVSFTSDENIKYAAGGQAMILSQDSNGFSFLHVALDGLQMMKVVLNIDSDRDGSVKFRSDVDGWTSAISIDQNGSNFFTLTGGEWNWIELSTDTSVTIYVQDDSDAIDGIKQVRIGAAPESPPPTNVPEPLSLALIGTGLLGLCLARRRAS